MKKILKPITLALLALLLVAMPVLAYSYSTSIVVTENDTSAYTQLPITASIDNQYLADNEYMSASGLDTRILKASDPMEHMLATNKTLFCSDITQGSQTNFNYTFGNSALSDFPIIIGYNGYITIADDADLESSGSISPFSSTSDGWIQVTDADYNTAWTATIGTIYASGTDTRIGQYTAYTLQKTFFFFDTSAIPNDATIISATLKLYGQSDQSAQDFLITIQNGQPDHPEDPLVVGDYNKTHYSGDGGSLTTDGFTTSGYNDIALNATGLAWINKTGTTKLCVRSDREIAGTVPTVSEYVDVYATEYSGTTRDPQLVISYSLPFEIEQSGYANTSIASALPSVVSVNGGNNTSDDTSHTVNLPSGISSGDLLLVVFASDGTPIITFPGGWTQLFSEVGGGAFRFGAWYRIADGTEGATITVTTSTSEATAHTSYRIINYSGVPEVGTSATAYGSNPDPPSLTPSWGVGNTLWFAVTGYNENKTVSAYPTGYTDGRNDYANVTTGCGVGSVRRELEAPSENPGTFTLSGSAQWVANTVAVRGFNQNLVYKEDAFKTYVSAVGSITSTIMGLTTVEAYNGGTEGTSTASHTVNLPAGITAGDLLLIFFTNESGGYHPTFPEGWTELCWEVYGTYIAHGVWYRIADGTEGSTITVTTSGTTYSSHASYLVQSPTGIPEAEITYGASGSPNPPSLTPSWGLVDTLWIANCGVYSSTITDYPDGFTDGIEYGIAGRCSTGVARKVAEETSMDPGNFTVSGSNKWVACTVGIKRELEVTATGISSGDIKVKTTADGTNLKIYIDDVEEDSIALSGASVPDNANDWVLNQNDVMPYMEYYKHTVSSTLIAWYQPNTMVIATDYDGTADAGGDIDTIIDAELTQADDYWIGALVTITDTGNGAPDGETSICTAFADATDEVTVSPAFTAGVDAGDTYTIDFGTLIDRQGGDEDGRITWGINPSGISYTIGRLESTGAVAPVTTEEPEVPSILPPTPDIDLFSESTGANIPIFYPFFKMASDDIGVPIQVFWYTSSITLAAVLGALALIYLRSLLIAALATGSILVVACTIDGGVISWWVLYIYAILAVVFIIYQRVRSV